MIKLMFCLRRLPSLSIEEFHEYWRNVHAPLVASVRDQLGMRRYVQNHTVADGPFGAGGEPRGMIGAPYDGVAELWWDSFEALAEAGSTREARRAGRLLLEDERNFIDLPNSPIFYCREHEIFTR